MGSIAIVAAMLYFFFVIMHACAVADTGGLQWFQLKPPLKECAPLISNNWYREEQKLWLVWWFRSCARG